MMAEEADRIAAETYARIQPNQKRAEYRWLARRVAETVGSPRTVLEIGTERGGTLALWTALAAPGARVVAVDNDAGRLLGDVGRAAGGRTDRLRVSLVGEDSHDPATVAAVTRLVPVGSADVVFIDGDHSYAGVSRDLRVYGPLTRLGGVVAFHDINPHGTQLPDYAFIEVSRLWAELRAQFPDSSEQCVENPEQICMGIGILHVDPGVRDWLAADWP